jgi:hypothetical protein
MRCSDCDGEGMSLSAGMVIPCRECQGSGIASCCDAAGSACNNVPDAIHPAFRAFRQVPHIPYTDCWCKPVEDPEEPGVFIHRETPDA